eukprot:16452386-Heterocapsa_arctica.AAC.1
MQPNHNPLFLQQPPLLRPSLEDALHDPQELVPKGVSLFAPLTTQTHAHLVARGAGGSTSSCWQRLALIMENRAVLESPIRVQARPQVRAICIIMQQAHDICAARAVVAKGEELARATAKGRQA